MIESATSFAAAWAARPATAAAGHASPAARYADLDPKLVAAAHQFEASMMAELLKPLNSGGAPGGDDDSGAAGGMGTLSDLTSAADGSSGALMSFGAEALANAISEKGGLGIARRALDHFEKEAVARGREGGATPAASAAKKTGMNPISITKVTGSAADKLMEGEPR